MPFWNTSNVEILKFHILNKIFEFLDLKILNFQIFKIFKFKTKLKVL